MESEQSFELATPLEQAWSALVDVERISPCVPGATLGRHNEDGSYDGEFKVKIGPTSAAYEGRLKIEWADAESHRFTLSLAGTDKRGQGGARATVVLSASATDVGTRIEILSDYHITGRLARFGRGGTIDELAVGIVAEFADGLRRLLADERQETVEISTLAESDLGVPSVGETETEPVVEPAPTPRWEQTAIAGEELVPSGFWDRAKANPGPVVAAILGFLLALRVLRRR
jgi:carbon monoxide dehydrogenase subunit G